MKRIYLDYASLTPIDARVLREMKRYSSAEYTNPLHSTRKAWRLRRRWKTLAKELAVF